jgi:hypothetical protein
MLSAQPGNTEHLVRCNHVIRADKLCGHYRSTTTLAPVAQRIEHLTTDQKVGGSNPSGRATMCLPRCGLRRDEPLQGFNSASPDSLGEFRFWSEDLGCVVGTRVDAEFAGNTAVE